MVERTEAKRKVKRIRNLPTIPAVVFKITKMVEDPRSSSADVAALIAQDQVLSAKVLRMANSPFFGMSRKISSITQALVLLGFDVVKGLVLTSSVSDLVKKSMDGLWEHSMGCAAAAGILARMIGRADAEEISLAGLLHDIGKAIMAVEMADNVKKIVVLADKHHVSFFDVETRALDFSHQDVGLWLAEHWNLPPSLSDPILYHHSPEQATQAPVQTALVHLADILIRATGTGFAGDPYVPPLSRAAWEMLELKPSDFDELLKELEPKIARLDEV